MQYSPEGRTNPGDLLFILSPGDRDLHGTPGKPRTSPRTSPRLEQFSKTSMLICVPAHPAFWNSSCNCWTRFRTASLTYKMVRHVLWGCVNIEGKWVTWGAYQWDKKRHHFLEYGSQQDCQYFKTENYGLPGEWNSWRNPLCQWM